MEKKKDVPEIVSGQNQNSISVPGFIPIQPKQTYVVCDMCGHKNPEETALCEMCSNYLI